jgi:DNA-binding transcriptional ArsR family regulator
MSDGRDCPDFIEKALNHPLRLRILEMHKREPGRSLSVAALTADLGRTPEYEGVSAAQVHYHRARLQDAKLLSL